MKDGDTGETSCRRLQQCLQTRFEAAPVNSGNYQFDLGIARLSLPFLASKARSASETAEHQLVR